MVEKYQKNAAILAIGDELLNGKTQDLNIFHLAGWLTERGIRLSEVRIMPDERESIVSGLNELRTVYDYVFTSGGIGPTHDDITAASVAEAFGVPISIRDDARAVLRDFYAASGRELTPARLQMARIPDGADLITNSASGAPGFQIENVFVLAGVPQVFKAMLEDIDHRLEHGPVETAMTVIGQVAESVIATDLGILQNQHSGISIGSYPGKNVTKGLGVAVVVRGLDVALVAEVTEKVAIVMRAEDPQSRIEQGAKAVE